MSLNLDNLTTAELLHEARKHLEAWETLTHILTDAPPGSLDPARSRRIWDTAEMHAELGTSMIELARLQLAEEVARHA